MYRPKLEIEGGGGFRRQESLTSNSTAWWINFVGVYNKPARLGSRRIDRQTVKGLHARIRDRSRGQLLPQQLLWTTDDSSTPDTLHTKIDLPCGRQARLYLTGHFYDDEQSSRWFLYDSESRDATRPPRPNGNRTWTEEMNFDIVLFHHLQNDWEFQGYELRKVSDTQFKIQSPVPPRRRLSAIWRAATGKTR